MRSDSIEEMFVQSLVKWGENHGVIKFDEAVMAKKFYVGGYLDATKQLLLASKTRDQLHEYIYERMQEVERMIEGKNEE